MDQTWRNSEKMPVKLAEF